MSSVRLLHVRTSFVVLEIYGPIISKRGVIRVSENYQPHLSIESTSGLIDAQSSISDIVTQEWSIGKPGPAFFEDTTYRLRVKSLAPGFIPTLVHRDPYMFKEIDVYTDDIMCAGIINFRRQIGYSTLEIRVGHENLRITIEVFPVKMDYNRDYTALLAEVASASRGLALEYLRATYRFGSLQEADYISNLEWITLLRNEINNLEKSIVYINANPHRSLSPDIDEVKIEKIRRPDAIVRRSIIQGRGRGSWIEIPNLGRTRNIIPALRSRDTNDTPENRWLRLSLNLILDQLISIHKSIAVDIHKRISMGRDVGKRIESEEQEVAKFVNTIKHLLSMPVFNQVTAMPPPGFTSLALLSSSGYREAYQSITILRMGLSVNSTSIDMSLMDLHDIYETWCFIKILQFIVVFTEGQVDLSRIIQVEESGIRVRLKHGKQSNISYHNQEEEKIVTVLYNPDFTGLTGNQRPDIVLRFQNPGWPDLFVVFDAKYRIDASDDYKKRFGIDGPPQDAINALHRYRDAIVIESVKNGFNRPVVKGVALFPLALENPNDFISSNLFKSLDVLGIGALPFLPSNTILVENWLRYLLTLPTDSLADPGPPFAGLSEKQKRAIAVR